MSQVACRPTCVDRGAGAAAAVGSGRTLLGFNKPKREEGGEQKEEEQEEEEQEETKDISPRGRSRTRKRRFDLLDG